jgi:hypothetical protein
MAGIVIWQLCMPALAFLAKLSANQARYSCTATGVPFDAAWVDAWLTQLNFSPRMLLFASKYRSNSRASAGPARRWGRGVEHHEQR